MTTEIVSRPRKSTRKFKAEVNQLLNILINSVYSNKEVFLRELISNASDALDKYRILSLTERDLVEGNEELSIFIEIDRENNVLSIFDNGIGMTFDEVVENIGTIAQSGSKKFHDLLEKKDKLAIESELIGQFGVGFYSSFIVADKVTIETRHAQNDMGVRWVSSGDGNYQIEEIDLYERGTRVILHLRDDGIPEKEKDFDENFLNQYTIQKHVQKCCNFIKYPIRMNFYTEESVKDKEGKIVQGKKETVVTEKTINSIQPIWEKDKKELSDKDYKEFYKQQFHDYNEPAEVLHFKGEGTIEFSALLFIPSKAPYDLYTGGKQKGVQLFNRNVLIFETCDALLPEAFKFVRGIVDTADLSLNISRELLQHDRQLKAIRNVIEKKVIGSFKKILKNDQKRYKELWDEFGKVFKGAIFSEYSYGEKLQDLLVFDSSTPADCGRTLAAYVENMPEGQDEIFYVTGEDRAAVECLPQMEIFKERGVEVLYFTDKIDEPMIQNLREYQEKKVRSIQRGEINLDFGNKSDAEKEDRENNKEEKSGESKDSDENGSCDDENFEKMLEFARDALEGKVKDVRLSKRLRKSPTCLVSDTVGYSMNMERLYRENNHTMYRAQKILELNPNHEMVKVLKELCSGSGKESKLKSYLNLIYNSALLIESEKVEDPVEIADLVANLIVEANQLA